jgi:hypothetical protein
VKTSRLGPALGCIVSDTHVYSDARSSARICITAQLLSPFFMNNATFEDPFVPDLLQILSSANLKKASGLPPPEASISCIATRALNSPFLSLTKGPVGVQPAHMCNLPTDSELLPSGSRFLRDV